MKPAHSLMSSRIHSPSFSFATESLALLLGVALLAALAQISLPLPFTPVPVTGQTFGVALISLLWGRRAFHVVASYLAIGFLGMPVFAGGLSGLTLGPTFGYLVGMLFASIVVGQLAERGAARSFGRAFASAYVGSVLIFVCGMLWLLPFVGADAVVAAGLLPFLPGDALKNAVAAWSASRAHRKLAA